MARCTAVSLPRVPIKSAPAYDFRVLLLLNALKMCILRYAYLLFRQSGLGMLDKNGYMKQLFLVPINLLFFRLLLGGMLVHKFARHTLFLFHFSYSPFYPKYKVNSSMRLILSSSKERRGETNMVYYTVPELALMLHVSKSYIYDIISRGQLKTVRLSERRTRITASAIEEFTKLQMDNPLKYNYNKSVVQPPKRGRKPNGTIQKSGK